MNLSDLRSTLSVHADFADAGLTERPGAVQHRVRVVRRRRRTALAGTAAAVVLAGAGIATLIPGGADEPDAADRTFGELTAPATMTSLGYTYSFDRLVSGTDEVTLADDIEGPVLVSWADAGDGVLEIVNPQDESASLTSRGDFDDFVVIGGNEERTVRLAGDGQVALAVYQLSDPAPGRSVEDDWGLMTFRDDIGSATAVASAWGQEGETDVTLTFAYPERTLVVRDFCAGPEGYDVHVDIAGNALSGECTGDRGHDGPGNLAAFDEGLEDAAGRSLRAGDPVTARIWVTKAGTDEPVTGTVPGLRLGLGMYEQAPIVATIGGWGLTEHREEAGHLYRFVSFAESRPGARGMSLTRTVTDRPLLFVLTGGQGAGRTRVFVDGELATTHDGGGGDDLGSFLATQGPFGPGAHTVELRTENPGRSGVAVYERAD
jgi:hypothetical protein